MSEPSGFRSDLSRSEQVEVAGHLGDIVRARIPLSIGLRALAEEFANKKLSTAFWGISQDLDAGLSIEVAFQNHSAALPPYLCSMVRAGSQSGNLGRALADYAEFMRMRETIRRNLQIALMYPLAIMLAASVLLGIMLAWIVPMFQSIFESFGTELPSATELLFYFSRCAVLLANWLPLTIAVIVGLLIGIPKALRAIRRVPTGAACLHALPLLGRLLRNQASAEFSKLLAMMIENRVPLPTALRLSAEGLHDGALQKCAFDLSRSVEQGQSLLHSASRKPVLSGPIAHAIVSAQGDEELVEGLRNASDSLSAQTAIDARVTGLGLEPVLTVVIGVLIGLIVISLFMPLFKVLNDLS